MSRDFKFLILCNNCLRKNGYISGSVNHNYQPILKNNVFLGIRITYRCFDCEETETKDLLITNPNDRTPKDKKDFQKKAGIKEQVKN